MAHFKSIKRALEVGYKIYTFHFDESLKEWFFGLKIHNEEGLPTYIGFWTKRFPKYITIDNIKKR